VLFLETEDMKVPSLRRGDGTGPPPIAVDPPLANGCFACGFASGGITVSYLCSSALNSVSSLPAYFTSISSTDCSFEGLYSR
jgi:hypothetical protein